MDIYLRNIVFGCPDPKSLAEFYAGLMEMRIIRDDWFVVARDTESFPRLAFGDGPGEYHPPRWPDPGQPQQLHLDISVDDRVALEQRAFRLGASLLQDGGDHRTYADPDGHPFCIYPTDETSPTANQLPTITRVVFDCFSPRSLASFYGELMDAGPCPGLAEPCRDPGLRNGAHASLPACSERGSALARPQLSSTTSP